MYVLAYDISINENKNEDIVCRRLLNKVLFNNNIDSYNYRPIPNTKINIIASDGNYQYHKIIKCKERKVVKVYKDKKTKRLLRDKEKVI